MIDSQRILHIIIKLTVVAAISIGLPEQVLAESPAISAKLSKSAIVMGDKISLDVQVVADRGVKGRFPIFDGMQPDGFAAVCGDTVELGANIKSSSIDLGSGRAQTDYAIPVQVFDSGFYSLPPIAYISGRDTVYTDPLSIKVVPVVAKASDEISDYTGVLSPGEGSFWDKIPLWLLEWWWTCLIFLLLITIVAVFLIRYKRVKLRRASKPMPPYQEACKNLEELNSQKLWQNGREKEYYTLLVDILRRYISRRFEIHAMEMTTDQILNSVKTHERIKPYLNQFRAVLGVADFAKFANMQCTPEENIGAFDEVKAFIDATRPTVDELKSDAEKLKKEEPRQKTARWERRQKKAPKTSAGNKRKEVKK